MPTVPAWVTYQDSVSKSRELLFPREIHGLCDTTGLFNNDFRPLLKYVFSVFTISF